MTADTVKIYFDERLDINKPCGLLGGDRIKTCHSMAKASTQRIAQT